MDTEVEREESPFGREGEEDTIETVQTVLKVELIKDYSEEKKRQESPDEQITSIDQREPVPQFEVNESPIVRSEMVLNFDLEDHKTP